MDRNSEKKSGASEQAARPNQPATCALLSRAQVAAQLNLCPHTVARYTRQGLLPCLRVNARLIRYRSEDVQAFIEVAAGN